MDTMQEKELKKDGYSLFYYSQGNPEKDLIVFLHPAFGDHSCFYRQMDVFAQSYHVISVDMLGHGKSQVTRGGVTIEQTATLVAEIIEREGHQQAHVAGVSLGSLMAQYLADKYPQKVKTVTVVGGYSIFGDNSAISKTQGGEMLKWFFLIIFSMERFRRYVAQGVSYVPAERELFYQSSRHITRRSMRVMSGMQKMLDKAQKSLSQPLLIITGEHDLPIVYKNSGAWHKREANSQFHIISQAGHCANMDNASEFNRILGEFLAANTKTKAGTQGV